MLLPFTRCRCCPEQCLGMLRRRTVDSSAWRAFEDDWIKPSCPALEAVVLRSSCSDCRRVSHATARNAVASAPPTRRARRVRPAPAVVAVQRRTPLTECLPPTLLRAAPERQNDSVAASDVRADAGIPSRSENRGHIARESRLFGVHTVAMAVADRRSCGSARRGLDL